MLGIPGAVWDGLSMTGISWPVEDEAAGKLADDVRSPARGGEGAGDSNAPNGVGWATAVAHAGGIIKAAVGSWLDMPSPM